MQKLFFLFILHLVFLSTLRAATESQIRKQIGVSAAWVTHKLSGKGVKVLVQDKPGKEEKDIIYLHADKVKEVLLSIAPHVNSEIVTEIPSDIDGAKIINQSYGLDLPWHEEAQENFYKWDLKAGVSYTIALGNYNMLFGTTVYSKALSREVQEINQDPKNTGAVIFAVSAPAKGTGDLTEYSNLPGLLASNTVVVPTSGQPVRQRVTKVEQEKFETFKQVKGTSYSAPIVAGCLALLAEAFPEASGRQLVALLLDTAKPFDTISNEMVEKLRRSTNLSKKDIESLPPAAVYGRGMVDVEAAIQKGKELLKAGESLPNEIKPVLSQETIDLIRQIRYDPFADQLYKYLKSEAQPDFDTIFNIVVESDPPLIWLIEYPLYEVGSNKSIIREYPKQALKGIHLAIQKWLKLKDHPLRSIDEITFDYESAFAYSNFVSAMELYYALTLDPDQRDKILKSEWEKEYAELWHHKPLGDKFLEFMPESLKQELGVNN